MHSTPLCQHPDVKVALWKRSNHAQSSLLDDKKCLRRQLLLQRLIVLLFRGCERENGKETGSNVRIHLQWAERLKCGADAIIWQMQFTGDDSPS